MSENYEKRWIDNFDEDKVVNYDNKFKLRFEKNLIHTQQIGFIKQYLKPEMYWCDCPIGSGRLMKELSCSKILGFDKSPAFLEFNKKNGIPVFEGDLFNNPFKDEFDLVTSLHTIFAFQNYKEILNGYIRSLRKGGILIVDIVNADYIRAIKEINIEHSHNNGMTESEIRIFFESQNCEVIETKLHSFYDNHFFKKWRKGGNRYFSYLKARLWSVANKLYFSCNSFRRLLQYFEKIQPKHKFRKYLVAARKL